MTYDKIVDEFILCDDINEAIKREKQLKNWKRIYKTELIEKFNVNWDDLYDTIL